MRARFRVGYVDCWVEMESDGHWQALALHDKRTGDITSSAFVFGQHGSRFRVHVKHVKDVDINRASLQEPLHFRVICGGKLMDTFVCHPGGFDIVKKWWTRELRASRMTFARCDALLRTSAF
jgi:hypothetical protein